MVQSVRRTVGFQPGYTVEVDLNVPVARYPHNPVLTAREVNQVWRTPALQVNTVHSAGVTAQGDETLMLFRSHLPCGRSVLGLARSKNGIDNWQIEPAPVLKPATKADLFASGTDQQALIENEAGGMLRFWSAMAAMAR